MDLQSQLHEANKKALLSIYEGYLTNKETFAEMEALFKSHNTTTKVELYKRFNDYVEGILKEYDKMEATNDFIKGCIQLARNDIDAAKLRIYKLTADSVARIDDTDFLNDLTK